MRDGVQRLPSGIEEVMARLGFKEIRRLLPSNRVTHQSTSRLELFELCVDTA